MPKNVARSYQNEEKDPLGHCYYGNEAVRPDWRAWFRRIGNVCAQPVELSPKYNPLLSYPTVHGISPPWLQYLDENALHVLHLHRPDLVLVSPGVSATCVLLQTFYNTRDDTTQSHCHLASSIPPTDKPVKNFASSVWYCSACRICVPVNIPLFNSASNTYLTEHGTCMLQRIWRVIQNFDKVFHKALRDVKWWQKVLVGWNKSYVIGPVCACIRYFLAGHSPLT